MLKKLNDLEEAMCKSLNFINDGDIKSAISIPGTDVSIAMHQCLYNGYVENLEEWKDANGNYHFNSIGRVHVNQNGLKFLQEMSLGFRIKNAVFDMLKGALGYILGVLTPLTVQGVLWIVKNSEKIQEFLLSIINKK